MLQEELNRFDRTLSILILLQSKKLVRAQEIADRFGVSLRTIYRDIKSLEAAGVPVIGEAGAGYTIMEGYRLPPVMFTKEEAGSFVAAEKLMQKFTDAGLGRFFESAMNKVKSVLKGKEKEWVAALEKQIWAEPSSELFNKNVPNALEILFNSIGEQKQVFLLYHSLSSNQPEQRNIEPIGVFHENNHWYLLAFCHLRNDYRQFRTDRIQSIKNTEFPFSKEHGSIDDHRKKDSLYNRQQRVVISVEKRIVRLINDDKKYYGFISQEEKEEEVEMIFMTAHSMEGLARWYLMFADYARIIEPETFKIKVREIMEKSRANLEL
jgi:predicted DNA-binding transcriptional regulator YafY